MNAWPNTCTHWLTSQMTHDMNQEERRCRRVEQLQRQICFMEETPLDLVMNHDTWIFSMQAGVFFCIILAPPYDQCRAEALEFSQVGFTKNNASKNSPEANLKVVFSGKWLGRLSHDLCNLSEMANSKEVQLTSVSRSALCCSFLWL